MNEGEPFGEFPHDPGSDLEPEEIASEGALTAAEVWLGAIAAGDAETVWDLFSDTAQAFIINLGLERGMDFDVASRLRAGVATTDEREDFLADLLSGLQRDLAGIDFSRLAFESKAELESPMQVRVNYLVQLGPEVAELQAAIPAGAIVLTLQDDLWRVERLVPGPRAPQADPRSE